MSSAGSKSCETTRGTNSSRAQSAVSLWRHPCRDEVLTKVHDFAEVSADEIPHKYVEKQPLPPTFFQPIFSRSSCDFKDLPARGASSWHGERAPELPVVGAMTDFLLALYDSGRLDHAPSAWKCCLMTPGLLVRKVGARALTFFSLGHVGSVVYLSPAECKVIGKVRYWQLRIGSPADLLAEPILSFSDWEVVPHSTKSPLAIFIANRAKPFDTLPALPVAESGEAPVSLLHWSAKQGFRGLTKAMLLKVDKEEVGCLCGETSIGDILLALVKAVLNIEDAAAAAILRQRCFSNDTLERAEALASEQAQEVLESNDKKECQDALRAEDKASDVQKEIAQTVRRIAQERRSSAPAAKKAKRQVRRWPARGVAISMGEAQGLCPPGARLYPDRCNGRYTCFFHEGSLSRSWRKYGESESFRMVVLWAWTMHAELTGEEIAVEGLQ